MSEKNRVQHDRSDIDVFEDVFEHVGGGVTIVRNPERIRGSANDDGPSGTQRPPPRARATQAARREESDEDDGT